MYIEGKAMDELFIINSTKEGILEERRNIRRRVGFELTYNKPKKGQIFPLFKIIQAGIFLLFLDIDWRIASSEFFF